MTNLVKQPTAAPTRKIQAAAIGGAIATILAWLLESLAQVAMPAPVVAASSTLLSVGIGYFVRDRAQ